MKITYDKDVDALYIEFVEREFFSNKKIDDDTIIDSDKDGNLLGIEVLNVSKKMPKESLSEINFENLVAV